MIHRQPRPSTSAKLTRRGFLSLAPAMSLFGQAPELPRTFLFLDWQHVNKGDLEATLDPARVTGDGRKLLEMYARDFKKVFDETGHGFRPRNMPSGVRIALERPEKSEPWLMPDQPWERSISNVSVIQEEGRYRCWYDAVLRKTERTVASAEGRVVEVTGSAMAYAESADGFHWTKPAKRMLSHAGSLENNLVSTYNNGGEVFRDDHGPAEERYKVFSFAELPKETLKPNATSRDRYGLYGVSSPDGYRWTRNPKPLIRYFADTSNIADWDPALRKYVGFFRNHLGGRSISFAETEDFWNWPEPRPILHPSSLDGPADDYYTNGYMRYPDDQSLRLLFAAIYHHDSDLVDVRLGTSRDGRAFQWASYEPIIPNGPTGRWDAGSVYAHRSLVRLPGGRLALPLLGYSGTHNGAWFRNFYGTDNGAGQVGWAIWKDARLGGIEAASQGEFSTIAARFDGSSIRINARTTAAGAVQVELASGGKPIDGFTFADAVAFHGDEVWTDLRWRGNQDIRALRGKNIELRVRLRAAKIFAYRFA
ncbi:MAG: hypothetical protein HYZ37_08045 [Candidatus Solibacter usitatus]|nr:hypothetical protein [Candidatus Solibacter usitatus]